MTDLVIDYVPRVWQRRCHEGKRRFTVYAIHRRAGKTEMALMELIDSAMQCRLKLGLYFYIAPYLNQARTIIWERLKEKLAPVRAAGAVSFSEKDTSVTFEHNGAKIRLFGADKPKVIRGNGLCGVVMDEVGDMRPQILSDVVDPMLADRLGWNMCIGTPNGMNLFSDLFFKSTTQNLPDWFGARYTCYETDSLPASEIARLKRDMSPSSFAREMLCDFTASADDQLISLLSATEASQREYVERDTSSAPVVLGVDPARFGNDRSVIFRRQGLVAFEPSVSVGVDNMALASRVASEIKAYSPDAVFIDAGAGAGVIDRLRQLGFSVFEVPFGGSAIADGEYVNRRTEMWFKMRDWVHAGGSIPNNAGLIQEMSTPTYWYDVLDKKVLEKKQQTKKRLHGGRSPDLADALCLTFASPVEKKDNDPLMAGGMRLLPSSSVCEYDPYKNIR